MKPPRGSPIAGSWVVYATCPVILDSPLEPANDEMWPVSLKVEDDVELVFFQCFRAEHAYFFGENRIADDAFAFIQ